MPITANLEDSTLDITTKFLPGIFTPRHLLDAYIDEFDQAYEDGTTALVLMHPHVTGQRSRSLVLDKLIRHMRSRDGVWFATHRQVAEYVLIRDRAAGSPVTDPLTFRGALPAIEAGYLRAAIRARYASHRLRRLQPSARVFRG